jgi:hypothetical protein
MLVCYVDLFSVAQVGNAGCGPMSMTGMQSKDVTMVKQSNSSQSKEQKAQKSSFEERLSQDVSECLFP